VRQIPNAGKARAVQRGFNEARGELVLFTDADGSSPIEELSKLHAVIRGGADVAIASRAMPDSDIVAQPGHRRNAGGLFRTLVSLLVMRGIRDTQCGFKLFKRAACQPVFDAQQVFTFAFDVELLFLARKSGLTIAEVGIRWINDEDTRVNFLKDGTKMVLSLLGIRLRYWLGRYRLRVR
jgi:dolichyl-phosphate beta-glucosyltransferase